jgi:hypothetical protein
MWVLIIFKIYTSTAGIVLIESAHANEADCKKQIDVLLLNDVHSMGRSNPSAHYECLQVPVMQEK